MCRIKQITPPKPPYRIVPNKTEKLWEKDSHIQQYSPFYRMYSGKQLTKRKTSDNIPATL